MNTELRDAIGKALYEASFHDDMPAWDELSEGKSMWMDRAEKVVGTFLEPFLPGITILGKELIKNNPSMRDMINQVFHQATGRDLDEA